MLAQLSIVFLVYLLIRFVLPLPLPLLARVGISLILALIALKFEFYKRLGGSFFMPDMPQWFMISASFLYSALLLLCILVVIRDLVLVVFWSARCIGYSVQLPLSGGRYSIILVGIALLLALVGTWQAIRVPDVVSRDITVSNLPPELAGLKIVQLSDLHISSLFTKDWLEEVVQKTNALKPDLILITGDMLDGSPQKLSDQLEPLKQLHARYGVFGVAGNHEYYSGFDAWMPIFKTWGITMLHNQHITLTINGKTLVLAGVTDPAASNFGKEAPNIQKALNGAPSTAFRILMAHQPRGAAHYADSSIQIQLSGHTHGGLITFVDRFLIAAYNDSFVSGWYRVGTMNLYVHPGTGLWGGFPLRLGVPSEISLITLK